MNNYPFAQQPHKQAKHQRQILNDKKPNYNIVNGKSTGSPPYGVMSFAQRGGYNSGGGTSGSGSSSQDVQKSPASRTSSKISYDSTGPNDERYYGMIFNEISGLDVSLYFDFNIKYKCTWILKT